MSPTVWKGQITFGLVSFRVRVLVYLMNKGRIELVGTGDPLGQASYFWLDRDFEIGGRA